jgi:hypothetical protein
MKCDSQASLSARNLANPYLGCEPKARVVTPLDVAQHQIKLDKSIPLAHQVRYLLNPNDATIVK